MGIYGLIYISRKFRDTFDEILKRHVGDKGTKNIRTMHIAVDIVSLFTLKIIPGILRSGSQLF